MKKIFFSFLFLYSSYCFGQSVKELTAKDGAKSSQSKELIRTANDLKSGNWQDVLASFFQLAAGDITGKDHALSFKANLFAIKAKADSTLLVDTNYVRQKFARNFQFDFSLKLDTAYHFNGFKAGFTWALLNKRDSTVVQFFNNYSLQFNRSLQIVLVAYRASLSNSSGGFNSPEDSLKYKKVKDAIDKGFAEGTFASDVFPKNFRDPRLDILYKNSDSTLRDFLKKVAMQPLLTLSAKGNFDKQKGFLNGGDAELVYLQGLSIKSGGRIESDLRANIGVKDTVLNTKTIRRTVFDIKAGFNISWVKNNKSIFEFKPYAEYKSILKGTIPGEKKESFYASGEFRLRVTDNLWVPLTIKYDVKKGNFLGFLNVSLNMNAFKKT
jgi:hypothetical protein